MIIREPGDLPAAVVFRPAGVRRANGWFARMAIVLPRPWQKVLQVGR
jgi:hypothetical protein